MPRGYTLLTMIIITSERIYAFTTATMCVRFVFKSFHRTMILYNKNIFTKFFGKRRKHFQEK